MIGAFLAKVSASGRVTDMEDQVIGQMNAGADIIPYMTGEAAKPAERVVQCTPQALRLFRSIGLTPPPGEGQPFDPAELDTRLAGLDISTRMQVKGHLTACGLLGVGRQIDQNTR